jgi:hypothetical protein
MVAIRHPGKAGGSPFLLASSPRSEGQPVKDLNETGIAREDAGGSLDSGLLAMGFECTVFDTGVHPTSLM